MSIQYHYIVLDSFKIFNKNKQYLLKYLRNYNSQPLDFFFCIIETTINVNTTKPTKI